MSTVNRARLACNACMRRKVKCSKTIPCTHCVRRGEEETCGIDANEMGAPNRPIVIDTDNHSRRPPTALNIARSDHSLEDHESTSDEPLSKRRRQNRPTETIAAEDEPVENEDTATKHAASILEFLAWGRRKDPDYGSVISPEHNRTSPGDALDAAYEEETGMDFDDFSQPSMIQLLLPSPRQVRQLVDYHEECLLWYHSSYSGPALRTQLEVFYNRYNGVISRPGVNLQWVALLFSVMTASLVCAPPERVRAWGFRDPERDTLSKRWFQAVTVCLNRAQYTSNLSIFSCQAIATSTVSAHLLGFSNSQSIHLAAAVRIAQSLSLHRLGQDSGSITMDKEIGRRVWCQLCYQDWFSIPFSESYLINPIYSTSEPPANCDDIDMVPQPPNIPTITSYCRFLYDIAAVMPQLQDGLMGSNTAYTRYKQVLSWDARLRNLATTERPAFFTNVPVEQSWPCWVPWARRALAITFSHKIIMIHRSFLSESFTNPAFAFTRRTCLAASKTIIKEYKAVVEEDGPVLWIHQAFSIAASIILVLDVLHRDIHDRECTEHQQLVRDIMEILQCHHNSMIAVRGVKLLEALLGEISRASTLATDQARKRKRDEGALSFLTGSTARKAIKFDIPAFVKALCKDSSQAASQPGSPNAAEPSQTPPPGYGDAENQDKDPVELAQFDLNFSFPHLGLDGVTSFENLLYLANNDIFTNGHGHP